jgi:ABC-type multidrug transport system fused ATPase/permease subunit
MRRSGEFMRGIGRLLGRRGIRLFLAGVAASVVLSLVEYAIALCLVLFLFVLGLAPAAKLPAWLPFTPETFPPAWIWAGMLGVALLQSAARILSFQAKILLTETVNSRLKLILAYLLLKKEAARPMPASEVDFLLSECFGRASGFVFYFTQTLSFAIQILLMTVGMLALAWGEALTGLVGLGAMALVVLRLNRLAQSVSRRVPEAGARLHRIKTRILRNWLLIRVLRIQDREYRGFLEAVFSGFRHNVLGYLYANLSLALLPVAGVLVLAAIVAGNVLVFRTPTAEFAAFLYLFIRLQQRLSNGANMMGDLFTSRHQFNACVAMVKTLSRADLAEALRPEAAFRVRHRHFTWPATVPAPGEHLCDTPVQCPPAIEVCSLTFRWPGRSVPVFTDLSFAVPAGAQFAIVGANGCGKSTLLGCLLGICRPEQGAVRLDGLEAGLHFERHAGRMAYVGPEPYLVEGTLRENLLYGLSRRREDADLWRALAAVGLEAFVRGLPAGLDSQIAENGDGLSSGQKQRLTIARAFLREPTLLVLDEPSANVDDVSEGAIADALNAWKGRCTVVVVSHRPGILRHADQTLNMDARTMTAAAPSLP